MFAFNTVAVFCDAMLVELPACETLLFAVFYSTLDLCNWF